MRVDDTCYPSSTDEVAKSVHVLLSTPYFCEDPVTTQATYPVVVNFQGFSKLPG